MYYGIAIGDADSPDPGFSASGVVSFEPVTLTDIKNTVMVSGSSQLNPSTPGGASMQAWADSGYRTDTASVSTVLAAGMSKSKNRVVREAGAASLQMGSTMFAGCSATGVGSCVAPLCGAMGAIVGAVAGVITAYAGARHEAAVALRESWWGANHALIWGIMSIRDAYTATGGSVTDEQSACLLVSAMKSRGSSYTDRIWGPYVTKSQAHDSECGIPWVICSDALLNLQTAQAHRPLPAPPKGKSYPRYAIMEKWWMLKSDHYGNCVNDGDIKPDAAWQDKTSTRRERGARMREISDQIFDAVEVVIATMINLRDKRSRELAAAYRRSEQYQRDVAAAEGAATGIQKTYGEFMTESSANLQRYCDIDRSEASSLLVQGGNVFLPHLRECQMNQLLDLGYSPNEAMQIISQGEEAIDEAIIRGRRAKIVKATLLVLGLGAAGAGGYAVYTRVKTGKYPSFPRQ